VRVANRHHFRYADGTRYINIGTTAYVWNLQGDALEEETLATLAAAPFTKIRMCVFPKHYRYNENEPERYPFKLVSFRQEQVGRQLLPGPTNMAGSSTSASSSPSTSATSNSASLSWPRSASRPT
jgi:hypothetical protein